jgi:hypothetical protein
MAHDMENKTNNNMRSLLCEEKKNKNKISKQNNLTVKIQQYKVNIYSEVINVCDFISFKISNL